MINSIVISIIKIIIFINNIITKFSLIYETEKELKYYNLEYIKKESSNYSLELTKITDKYYDLEIEYKKHLDDYFNLKLLVDNQVNLNKRLRFKLKDAYSSIRSLRNKIIKYYKNQEI